MPRNPTMKSKQKKINHSTSGGTSKSRGAAECIGEEQITDLSKTHVDDVRTPDSTGKEKECMKLKKNLEEPGKLDNNYCRGSCKNRSRHLGNSRA